MSRASGGTRETGVAAEVVLADLREPPSSVAVPIWKHQIFEDGSDGWVGTP